MTPEERRDKLREILDAHDAAAREFRHQSFDATLTHLRHTLDAMQQSHASLERAIDAMLAANRTATALFNEDKHE